MKSTIQTLLLIGLLPSSAAWSANVDLVTLPKRDSVQLTIYNSEDLTLAREQRFITLKKGNNRLQFSWAGTLIDPTSVEFRPLQHADKIEIADTVYPGQKPQHLIWNIESEFEGQLPVEVSYFTSGLAWKMDYVATTNPEETNLRFRGYVRVHNHSGEEYRDAQIRLIVGKINLVEKIAQLAQRHGRSVPLPDSAIFNQLRRQAANEAFDEAEGKWDDDVADSPREEKRIVKEGLSEYFMFSVAGTETIASGWSKRMSAVKADEVTFDIVYRLRQYQYGPRPVRFFIWSNDEEHGLGESPLPDGTVRIFRDHGKDGLSYLGQQLLRYVPIKADIEVNLGTDDLVVYQQRKTATRRMNFQFNRRQDRVTGWDEQQQWLHIFRNYRDRAIVVEMRLQWNGDVDVLAPKSTTSFDYRTLETRLAVGPRQASRSPFTVTTHFGTNQKQQRVKLKTR